MALSAVLNGTQFTIKNEISAAVFALFTEETNFSFEETRGEIDVSSKSSAGNFQAIAGQYKATFSVDALIIDGDPGIAVLQAAIRGSGMGVARRFQNNVEVDEFDYLITSFTRTGGNEEAGTYSMSGTLCGQPRTVV